MQATDNEQIINHLFDRSISLIDKRIYSTPNRTKVGHAVTKGGATDFDEDTPGFFGSSD